MRKIMTDKKDPKDFDFTDSNDFDFGDEVAAKDEPPIAVVPETNDFDFDFDDEPTTPIGENVIKRQNTITEQDIKSANNMRENIKKQNTINEKEAENVSVPSDEYDFDLDDKDDFDFGSSKPKPTLIRKIDCTSLNDIEKDFIRLVLALRDQIKRISLLNDNLISERFVHADLDNRLDYIGEIMKDVATSKKLEVNGKRYFLKALKKYGVELIFIEIDIDYQDIEKIIQDLSK